MPFVDGKTLKGWGVFRGSPWHFVGIFSGKEEADQKAKEVGEGYEVRFGENQEGTDNFVWSNTDTP